VAQSVEAVEFLSKNGESKDSESESESESDNDDPSGGSSSNSSNRRKRKQSKRDTASPVCLMLSGYIDGYVKQTIGACACAHGSPLYLVPEDLVTVEVACKSQGAECCEFVTAHVDQIADVIKKDLDERVRAHT
jgi:hypothetical protein